MDFIFLMNFLWYCWWHRHTQSSTRVCVCVSLAEWLTEITPTVDEHHTIIFATVFLFGCWLPSTFQLGVCVLATLLHMHHIVHTLWWWKQKTLHRHRRRIDLFLLLLLLSFTSKLLIVELMWADVACPCVCVCAQKFFLRQSWCYLFRWRNVWDISMRPR